MHIIEYFEKHKIIFAAALLCTAVVLRAPTLFNDYYDNDELAAIVQTHEWLAGDKPGVDFLESKLPLYHAIFKLSYTIAPVHGWVAVHACTMLIIFFTSLFIYATGRALKSNRAAIIGAFLYAVLISSFNRHFMATNGEIIYNLPLTAALFLLCEFFALKNSSRAVLRPFILLLSFACGIAACYVKFHGIIFFIFLAAFFALYYPYYRMPAAKKYYLILGLLCGSALIAAIAASCTGSNWISAFINNASGKLYYAVFERGFNPILFIGKSLHHQAMLALWHAIAWVPAAVLLWQFCKKKFYETSIERSAVILFFFSTYLLAYAGGTRLYFHYYMPCYPALCLLAGLSFESISNKAVSRIKNKCCVYLLVPALFFFAWNIKDLVVKYYFPGTFLNESKTAYNIRAVVTGQIDDYLLPKGYAGAVEYLKQNTVSGDRLFVWGDGPCLYYFSGRRMGIKHLWPRGGITSIVQNYAAANIDAAVSQQNVFIADIETKKPEMFIDTQPNGMAFFHTPLAAAPVLEKYVLSHYRYEASVDKIRFYRRIK